MKNINLENVQEASFDRLPAGGYVCGITAVEDVPAKEYIRCEFDIAEGEYKNYYRNLYNSKSFWGGVFVKSYKTKALPFFKTFVIAVENSNKGYTWDNDETKLKRKLVGIVLAEEEYVGKDGTTKTRLYAAQFLSAEDVRKGKYTVPELKRLAGSSDAKPAALTSLEGFETVVSEDAPF